LTLLEPEKSILKLIKPSTEDYRKAGKIYETIKQRLETILKKHEIEARIELEGSIAKDTWLKTDPEMDVFIILPSTANKEDVELVVSETYKAFKDLSPILSYAQHPYLQLNLQGFEVDIVPSIERKGERIVTAVDRTPYHTRFIKENTTPQLRDEIRVIKKFMKTIGTYGAEIKIEGFSGYLIELLALHYGGFRELLESASKWHPPIILTKGRPACEKKAVFCIADPTDERRNVASALSMKKIAEFSLAARLYLRKPSLYYFVRPDKNFEKIILNRIHLLEPYYPYVVILEFLLSKSISPENLWGEIKRACRNVEKILNITGFKTVRCDSWTDEKEKGYIACIIENPMLYVIEEKEGPPFYNIEHSKKFLDKYLFSPGRGPWVNSEGKLVGIAPRKTQHPIDALYQNRASFLVSDLKEAKLDIYMLSWKPEKLEGEDVSWWLREFLFGKPKWLLPHYYQLLEERTIK
jgi:tRNA nucleotidyltransferase (CCA-adding enzyme)